MQREAHTVEVANVTNSGHVWPFTQETLRGRWDFQKTAHRNISMDAEGMKRLAREVGSIPGLFIQVDDEQWKGRIFDPLKETPEGQKIWDKCNSVFKLYGHEFEESKLHKTVERDLSADELKHWLEKMVQGVQSGNLEVVAGSAELPTPAEVLKMPGRISNNVWGELQETKEKEDPNDPRPMGHRNDVKVPASHKPKPATADAEG